MGTEFKDVLRVFDTEAVMLGGKLRPAMLGATTDTDKIVVKKLSDGSVRLWSDDAKQLLLLGTQTALGEKTFSAPGGLHATGNLIDLIKSRSGDDLLILVDNTSNTASSQSVLKLQVAGSSAGDAFLHLSISGATDWSLGPDNSDSDKFKISKNATLGTNDFLVIDTNGNVGIGTASPGALLDVNGTLTVAGTITANGGVTLGVGEPLTLGDSQLYTIDGRGVVLTIQSKTSSVTSRLEQFSKDGDGTVDVKYFFYGVGTPASPVNNELMEIGYESLGAEFQISTQANGTGALRNLVLFTEGNTNQLRLTTSGEISMGGDVFVSGQFHVNDALAIDTSGNVIIGTSLEIESSYSSSKIIQKMQAASMQRWHNESGTPNATLLTTEGIKEFAPKFDETTNTTTVTLDSFTLADNTAYLIQVFVITTGGHAPNFYTAFFGARRNTNAPDVRVTEIPGRHELEPTDSTQDITMDISGNDARLRFTGHASNTVFVDGYIRILLTLDNNTHTPA